MGSTGEVLLPNSCGHWQHTVLEDCWTEREPQLFAGCQLEDTFSVCYVGLSIWPGPLHMAAYIKASKEEHQQRESASKMEVRILHNVFTQVISCHLCHILLLRSKLQVLPNLKGGREVKQGHKFQEIVIIWAFQSLSATLPSSVSLEHYILYNSQV